MVASSIVLTNSTGARRGLLVTTSLVSSLIYLSPRFGKSTHFIGYRGRRHASVRARRIAGQDYWHPFSDSLLLQLRQDLDARLDVSS